MKISNDVIKIPIISHVINSNICKKTFQEHNEYKS